MFQKDKLFVIKYPLFIGLLALPIYIFKEGIFYEGAIAAFQIFCLALLTCTVFELCDRFYYKTK